MSTPTTLNVVGMPHAAEPRGARWAAALWHAVASFLADTVWPILQDVAAFLVEKLAVEKGRSVASKST